MRIEERIRQTIKTALSCTLYYSGGLRACRAASGNKPVILMYHRVLASMQEAVDYSPDGMNVSAGAFEMHISYLSRNYRVVPLTRLAGMIEDNASALPPNLCAVTFDDGWKDVYDNAFPVLRKYGLSATVFLTTDYVEGNMPFWEERLRFLVAAPFNRGSGGDLMKSARLQSLLSPRWTAPAALKRSEARVFIKEAVLRARQLSAHERSALLAELEGLFPGVAGERHFLSWAEASVMAANGIEFGSHTVTHTSMDACDAATMKDEIVRSKRIIEERLGKPVAAFAYPYGKHKAAARDVLKEAGYRCACSTRAGFAEKGSDPLLLNRINIHEDVSFCRPMFACRIARPFNIF